MIRNIFNQLNKKHSKYYYLKTYTCNKTYNDTKKNMIKKANTIVKMNYG